MDGQLCERQRSISPPIKTSKLSLLDAEMELLRTLEEEVTREDEKSKHDKITALLTRDDDDDYDESDDEDT